MPTAERRAARTMRDRSVISISMSNIVGRLLPHECTRSCVLSHNTIYDYDNSRRLWRSKIATIRVNNPSILKTIRG